jgi:Domain of unknown function (DUF4159)
MIRRVTAGAFIIVVLFAGSATPDRVPKQHAEYTFARVEFNMGRRGGYNQEGQPPWMHDYPRSEDFFLAMVGQVTGVRTSPDAYQIVSLDSEEIFRYPFLYFSEPGFMDLTDKELKNLRAYFNRGGFAMFDDFRGNALVNLEEQMLRVFPDRQLVRVDIKDPVFHSFYEIDTLDMPPPYMTYESRVPSFWGMKDDKGRLILIANADNDFGEFWEDIDRGAEALHPAVQSFQFGVNYLIYAMTH